MGSQFSSSSAGRCLDVQVFCKGQGDGAGDLVDIQPTLLKYFAVQIEAGGIESRDKLLTNTVIGFDRFDGSLLVQFVGLKYLALMPKPFSWAGIS